MRFNVEYFALSECQGKQWENDNVQNLTTNYSVFFTDHFINGFHNNYVFKDILLVSLRKPFTIAISLSSTEGIYYKKHVFISYQWY